MYSGGGRLNAELFAGKNMALDLLVPVSDVA